MKEREKDNEREKDREKERQRKKETAIRNKIQKHRIKIKLVTCVSNRIRSLP